MRQSSLGRLGWQLGEQLTDFEPLIGLTARLVVLMGYERSRLNETSLHHYMDAQFAAGQGLAHLLARVNLRTGTVHAFIPDDDPGIARGYANGSMRDADEESAVVELSGIKPPPFCGASFATRGVKAETA